MIRRKSQLKPSNALSLNLTNDEVRSVLLLQRPVEKYRHFFTSPGNRNRMSAPDSNRGPVWQDHHNPLMRYDRAATPIKQVFYGFADLMKYDLAQGSPILIQDREIGVLIHHVVAGTASFSPRA